jgi:hypothetical protein
MANIEIAAMTGRQVVLNSDVIEQLRGGHLLRGDDGYEAARMIFREHLQKLGWTEGRVERVPVARKALP